MTAKILTPSNFAWGTAIKNLVAYGDMSVEQANDCYRRMKGGIKCQKEQK